MIDINKKKKKLTENEKDALYDLQKENYEEEQRIRNMMDLPCDR